MQEFSRAVFSRRASRALVGAAGTLLVPGLAGCGGGGTNIVQGVTPVLKSPSAVVTLPNGLLGTVTEDRLTVPVDGTVHYTLTLTNISLQPITFQTVQRDTAPSGGIGDALTITDAKGAVVFPQGAFGQVVTEGPSTTLAPNQSVSGALAVGGDPALGQFSAAGAYFARVTFTVQPASATAASSAPISATTAPLEVDAQ